MPNAAAPAGMIKAIATEPAPESEPKARSIAPPQSTDSGARTAPHPHESRQPTHEQRRCARFGHARTGHPNREHVVERDAADARIQAERMRG